MCARSKSVGGARVRAKMKARLYAMSRNMLTTETNGFKFLKRNKQNVNIGTIKIVRMLESLSLW